MVQVTRRGWLWFKILRLGFSCRWEVTRIEEYQDNRLESTDLVHDHRSACGRVFEEKCKTSDGAELF